MQKARVLVEIRADFNKTTFPRLKELSVNYAWDERRQEAVWTFPQAQLSEALSIIGKPISLPEEELLGLVPYCPSVAEQLNIDIEKGVGEITITETPTYFLCTHQQNGKNVSFEVPKENVRVAWEVIWKQPLFKEVKTSTVAKNIIEALGITRFHRPESGTFNFAFFFGSRKDYFTYLYFPLKILVAKGYVRHDKKGSVTRLTEDSLGFQTHFEVEKNANG